MSNIRYIIHTADLHIGKGVTINREDEFRSVFAKFSENVNKHKPNETIVVIAGDIFDRKDNLTAYEISLFDYLINSLSKYEIIIIPGNHDGIVNNPQRMDLLSPLVKHHDNIIYLRDTAVLTHRGATFIHISVYDPCGPEDIKKLFNEYNNNRPQGSTDKPILLYHGAINGCKFNNYIESNSRITTEIQNNCKAVLAGDIHEMQFIGGGNVAYSGSLLQHEVDESHDKGYILWDILNNKNGAVKIPNEYCQYKLDLNKLSLDDIKALNCAKNVHKVNVIMDTAESLDTTADPRSNTNEKLAAIKEKFGRIDNVCKVSKLPQTRGRSQSELLKQLLLNEKAEPHEIESILQLHSELVTVQPVRKWFIKSVKFSNMYRYGPNNHIDFDIYSGDIIGVIANNQAGKSTILDVIMFGLYNILLRGGSKNKVNHHAKNIHIEIIFCVNGETYTIERTDYTSCKSHKLTKGNENITEKSVNATYDKIKSLIGSHTEFLATSMYYDNTHDIIRMTPSARKCLFASLFGVYEKKALIDKIKLWIHECENKIMSYGMKPRTIDIITADIEQNERAVETLSSQLLSYEGTYNRYEAILKAAIGQKIRTGVPIAAINADIANEIKIASECKKIIDNLNDKIVENCIDAPAAHGDKEKLLLVVGDYPSSDVLRKEIELLSANIIHVPSNVRDQAAIQAEINNLQCDVESGEILKMILMHEDRKRHLKDINTTLSTAVSAAQNQYLAAKKTEENLLATSKLQYNSSCEQCKHNMSLVNADLSLATTNTKLYEENLILVQQKSQAEIQKNEQEISILSNTIARLMHKHNLDQELENSNKYATSVKAQVHLSQLKEKLSLATASEAAIKQLRAIHMYEQSQLNKQLLIARQKLDAAKIRLETLAKELEAAKQFNYAEYNLAAEEAPKLRQKIFELGASRAVMQHKHKELLNELQNSQKYYSETPELYNKIRIYELYKKCIDVKGLITLIVKENMSAVVDRVNNILSQLTTFKIEHSADDNNISFDIIDCNNAGVANNTIKKYTYDIDVASGFQKFIISLVMRLVLSYALPTSCQCMFIDEGFACMDKNNIEKLQDLFNMLKQEYKYIFIISHLQDIQNIIERRLYIHPHPENSMQSHIKNIIASVTTSIAPNTAPNTAPNPTPKNAPISALVVDQGPNLPAQNVQPDDMIICDCGIQIKKRSKYMHIKSKKHSTAMSKRNDSSKN
jgi:exonuclease SbcC